MAIDMRRDRDTEMPATNVVSMCFLDRRPADMQDEERLLHSIRIETQDIKTNYLGTALIRAVRWFSSFRGGMQLLMKPSRLFPCHSTAVLSNLGEPFAKSKLPRREDRIAVGGAELLTCELLPPYRPGTPLAVGVATAGATMRLTLHYNAQAMNLTQATELRSLLERQVRTTLSWKPQAVTDLIPATSPIASGGPLWSLPIGKNVKPQAAEAPSFF